MANEDRLIPVVILSLVTCVVMICSILFFPFIKISKIKIDSYWVIVIIGAIIVVAVSETELSVIGESLIEDSAVNPLKILGLFICMTLLSVFIDELGFFQVLANVVLKKASSSQIKLFLYLYLTVSVLTVFTSNDVIILSFTPFICYFAKNAGISPIPYLASEFIAANTWSMTLIIGNPTNIYLGTAFDINFVEYLKTMIVPTIAAGIVAFICLLIMFRKELKIPIEGKPQECSIKDFALLIEGLVLLGICVIMLAIGSYIGVEMWIVAVSAAGCLFIVVLITCAIKKRKPVELGNTLLRAPWQLIPFVLGMYVIILCNKEIKVTNKIGDYLADSICLIKYGGLSFIAANIINNIPMSVLFCPIMDGLEGGPLKQALFATVVGSNIGAFFTPIGALAGIMWTSIVSVHGIKFGYVDFLKLGIFIAIPTIIITLAVLYLMLMAYGYQ